MGTGHHTDAGAPPVVVVGAGLTGMAAASVLAARGFPVTVVERNERTAFRLPRDPPRLRPGAPQAEHPHTLRIGRRDVPQNLCLRPSRSATCRAYFLPAAKRTHIGNDTTHFP